MKLHYLHIFLAVIFINKTSVAQTNADKIKKIEAVLPVVDSLFKDFSEKRHLPGLVYGLVSDGKLIHSGSIGYSNVTNKTLANTQSAFRIASMSKSFTAMAILKLRDEGKLKLDDPAYLYIPEMKGQHYLTTDAPDISIRNLLTHSAGFPEDNPWGDRQLAITDEAMIEMIKKGISFSNVPGIKYEYSNMGFAMLGYIIKQVSGKSYQHYITENILHPLGMNHTYWEYSKVPEKQLAHGYLWQNGKWIEQPLLHDGAYGAMGGLITSAEDFSKYVAFNISAWPPNNDKETGPVKRSSLREMQQPWQFNSLNMKHKYPGGRSCAMATSYGYGLVHYTDCEGRRAVGHSGGLPGFGSQWRILQDYGIGVFSFSNHTYAAAGVINAHVLDTLVKLAKLQPRKVPVSAILNQRKNELAKLLPDWKNAESSGIFAENFFLDYSIDALKRAANTAFSKAGKIIQVSNFAPENNLRGSFIMEGEKSNIKISFTLTPENPPLIQEYHIEENAK